ncbi:hypothetical protein JKA74_14545 [Marivirga sp. S37H4]|uniref:STAS/SEC14 domain-containing protein n=1 Tax=Marivirga aurantiaca TaxID=2802615 RepID=A0A935CAL7_9BACT|nr:hypothetical protein [Marivirga aurantiaca]MBK6266262.1 hypothetical protein [Marivirga aurantiaca]
MSYTKVIDYKDIKIVYTNIVDTAGSEAVPTFDKVQKLVAEFPDKSVLSCVNATNARFNTELLSKIKETVKKNNPKAKATVVCGLNKLSTLILNSIIAATGRQMKLFNTEEEGMAWLYEYEMQTTEIAASA